MNLLANHGYRYRACAEQYGQTPDCSQWVAAQTLPTPPPASTPGVPTFTSASAGIASITVSWTSPEDYGFYNVRWAKDGDVDDQNKVEGMSFTVGGLLPGTYHFIIQGCNDTILWGANCGAYSAPIQIAIHVPVPPPPPPPPLPNDFIYSVTLNNDLMWYRHDGRNDGTYRWAYTNGKKVGSGWEFKELFSGGNGIIYGVTPVVPVEQGRVGLQRTPITESGGDLMWARHLGRQDGSFGWDGPKKVGSGWGSLRNVFSGGEGIIYGVTPVEPATPATGTGPEMRGHPASGGDLIWFRHLGAGDGSEKWTGPKKVGSGWGTQQKIFSGGDGIIYAITPVVPALLPTGIGPGMGGHPASGGDLV